MVTGRVLQFDQVRGYGFVGADDGGEDVFLHASVFDGNPDALTRGLKVKCEVMASGRGRKAFAARLIDDELDSEIKPLPAVRPTPSVMPTQVLPGTGPQLPDKEGTPDEDQMCDVLSPTEFGREFTELLLSSVPTLTGQQVLEVRHSILECVRKHGWVDI